MHVECSMALWRQQQVVLVCVFASKLNLIVVDILVVEMMSAVDLGCSFCLSWPPLVVLQSFLVAVVIPEKKEIQSFAKQQGISGDYSDFLKNDKVLPAVHIMPSITCYSGSINCTRASLRVLINRKRKEKTTPVGVNSMRSLVVYQAAQMF